MLRDYQEILAQKAKSIIETLKIVYLAMEMRVGKTLIAFRIAELLGVKNVIFFTKKKAITSIQNDYKREGFKFNLTVINYEQAEKYKDDYDLVIVDEAHSIGAYPPAKRTKYIKSIVKNNYLILVSGTSSPESYTQLFHQFWVSNYNPFNETNFYKWAKIYVNIKEKVINGYRIKDYSEAKRDDIMKVLKPYYLTFTRQEAGFNHYEAVEEIKTINIDDNVNKLIRYLIKNRYFKFQDGNEIICDTAVKLQQKIHQLYSGTIKTENGTRKILDLSKLEYIKQNYKDKKIAIYYKFIAEGIALKENLSNWTEDPEEFNKQNNTVFISQIQSGSMGINLVSADILLFYNIDFSSVQYQQAKDRLQSLHRTEPPLVHFLFSNNGIEHKIYSALQKKKDYTVYYFQKDFLRN